MALKKERELTLLSNHEAAVRRSGLRSNKEEILNGLSSEVPVFTLELLISLGLTTVPPGDYFEGTSLSGCEGKSIFELSQPELEKIVLWAAGFTRDIRYAATHMLEVSAADSPRRLKKKIGGLVSSFLDQNCNVTIRIHNGNANGTTSKPVAWISPGDIYYLDEKGSVLTLRLVNGEEHIFTVGDKLKIFSSPASIDREMIFRRTEELKEDGKKTKRDIVEEKKKINLGGGFICKLGNYDSAKGIFSLVFHFITNNGNPRNIGDNNPKYPEMKVNIDVSVKDGSFVLVDGGNVSSLREAVNSQDMARVFHHTANNIIFNEQGALYRLFITSLNIYPKLNFHAVKGFYAIEEGKFGKDLRSSSMTFDTEGAEQAELWDGDFGKAGVKNPSPLLRLVYERLGVSEREFSPSERILMAQLALNGELWQSPSFDSFVPALLDEESEPSGDLLKLKKEIPVVLAEIKESLEESKLNLVNHVLEDDPIEECRAEVVKKANLETNKIIQSLLGKRKYMNNSAESLFGRLISVAVGPSNFRKVEGYDGVYEHISGTDTTITALIMDQGDHQIGFLVQDGKIINLEELLGEDMKNASNFDRFKAIRKIVRRNFGLQIPDMMTRYVLD